ncbi:MAG: hypothetical protein ACETWM_13720 [Candidatus Lokiarchaeia archaeon]
MKEFILSGLKKLLHEIESGELVDINGYISDCWEELSFREKDTSIPPEVITRNREILEELTVVIREHREKSIGEETLHQIKFKLFGEQPKKESFNSNFLHLKEDISDIEELLTEIERKMKKEKNEHKE